MQHIAAQLTFARPKRDTGQVMTTSDRKIIEDQLRAATEAGNKSRAKKLKKRLKEIKDYDSGKATRVKHGIVETKDFDKYGHHYPGRTKFDKAASYLDTRARARSGDTSIALVAGDRKRARRQKLGRHARNINKHIEHPYTRIGLHGAGLASAVGGAVYANLGTSKEAALSRKAQRGAASNNNRKKIRNGLRLYTMGVGIHGATYLSGSTKAGLAGGAAGLIAGGFMAKLYAPNNTKTSKKYVYFEKQNGVATRTSVNNPYYYQQRGNKKVRVKKGKRK